MASRYSDIYGLASLMPGEDKYVKGKTPKQFYRALNDKRYVYQCYKEFKYRTERAFGGLIVERIR